MKTGQPKLGVRTLPTNEDNTIIVDVYLHDLASKADKTGRVRFALQHIQTDLQSGFSHKVIFPNKKQEFQRGLMPLRKQNSKHLESQQA